MTVVKALVHQPTANTPQENIGRGTQQRKAVANKSFALYSYCTELAVVTHYSETPTLTVQQKTVALSENCRALKLAVEIQ